ncbi:MAG: MBL fold metallo-hydrolase [Bacteroidia bacterium]|nr:MBL fold metallo-hydrolase [Bacteroidia bacterium]
MKVEQIYTGCLAQGAYYISSEGEALIIDPLREIAPYLTMAEKEGVRIKYILETHFHADFVSGHIDLAKATGAKIIYGPTAKPQFEAYIAKDGEEFKLGSLTIRVIHTPGHTMESTCYLLLDEMGKPHSIYTGDTLFIGDVGRPDLAQKVSADLTQEKQAGFLYDSLRNKIMTLPDEVIVYPGHGAGSACGKNMSKETVSTIGAQKQLNYALRQDMSKEEFIHELLDGLAPPPAYFPANVMMNIQGYKNISEVIHQGTKALNPDTFELVANETEALILDTRDAQRFAAGFIPNSINIGIDGGFAPWVGSLIPDINQPLLIVAESGREEEVVTRLARVGYDNTLGFLSGGFEAWKQAGKETDTVVSISADTLAGIMGENPGIKILDIRKPGEYVSEHIDKVSNLPLDYLNENMSRLNKDETYYVHCAGGYRSMIFCSILKARGYENVIDIQGGFKAINQSGKFHITDYVCPTTLK